MVEQVEGKAKLSQNRSDADRAGVVAGLAGTPDQAVADAVRAALEQDGPDGRDG